MVLPSTHHTAFPAGRVTDYPGSPAPALDLRAARTMAGLDGEGDGWARRVIREIHRIVTWVPRRARHKTAEGLRSLPPSHLTGPT